MKGSDPEINALLERFEKNQFTQAEGHKRAVQDEDAWIARFNELRAKVLRPTLESLGSHLRARGHEFVIVETQFRRDNRAIPDEASIRLDLYLSSERTRTGIGMDRRPHLAFTTNHRHEMVEVNVSDITAVGGVISKLAEYPIERIDPELVREKFIVVLNRLLHK